MQVLASLVHLRGYRDRYVMLQRAAEQIGHIHLVTDHVPPGWNDFVPTTSALTLVGSSLKPARWPFMVPKLNWAARSILEKHKIDLVHDHMGFLWPLFSELRLHRRRPALLTSSFASTYDWYAELRRGVRSGWGSRERTYWQAFTREATMIRLADGFAVFGEGHRAGVARTYGVPVDRVHSLPNCVDPDYFRPQPPDPGLTGFEPGARVLLFVGSIFRYKGYYELVEAFGRVYPRHPDARLLLVGSAPPGEAEAVAALPAAQGVADKVRFSGDLPRERLPALMAACAAFVLPSYAEGTPRAMIEAMACGMPLVGTRIPGIQTLDPDARFIYFAERQDVGTLAEALDRLLSDPAEARARGEAGRARFAAHHTPEAAAAALAALYRELAASRPRG